MRDGFRIFRIIIITLMTLVIGAISILFGTVYFNSIRNDQQNILLHANSEIQTVLNSIKKQSLSDAENILYTSPIPDDYFGILQIDANNANIKTREYVKSLAFKSGVDPALIKDFDLFSFYDLFDTKTRSDDLFLSRSNLDKNVFLLRKVNDFSSRFSLFDFQDVLIVSDSGMAKFSFVNNKSDYNFVKLFDDSFMSVWTSHVKKVVFAPFNKENSLILLSDTNEYLRVVSIMTDVAYSDSVNKYIVAKIVELLSIICIMIITFLIVYNNYKHRFDKFYLLFPINNYVIHVATSGKIIWANPKFRNFFDAQSISGKIINNDGSISKNISAGKPIIVDLVAKNGDIHSIIFNTIWSTRGYKLVGSDITATTEKYRELRRADIYEHSSGLPYVKKFYESFDSQKNHNSGVVAIIKSFNLDDYKIMLGRNFIQHLVQGFSSLVRDITEEYGTLYYIDDNSYLLHVKDSAHEFANLLPEISHKFAMPISIGENKLLIDTRLGAVIYDSRMTNLTAVNLIDNANRALDNIAFEGATTKYFLTRQVVTIDNKIDFTKDGVVKSMIDNGEIEVFFQPQLNIKSNKIVGLEALTRIVSDKNKQISIGQFISIAETHGGIIELGKFVYKKSMEFAKKIQNLGVEVSVNVSPLQLMQMGFVDEFLEYYHALGLKKHSINIEITESIAVKSFSEIIAKLNILKENGINTHIDDFGVAYSSILYLKKLPVSTIKIDKSLINDIVTNQDNKNIIASLVQLTKNLHLKTIAEGVEDAKQKDVLEKVNCDMIQGFLVSGALNETNIISLIKEYNGNDCISF